VLYPVGGAIVAPVVRRSSALLETVTAALLGLDVVLTSLGSSSVDSLRSIGSLGRWVALGLLWVCAVALAVRRRHGVPSRPLTRLAALTAALDVLALLSAAWSAAPRLSFERGVTLLVATTALGLLAYAVERDLALAWTLLGATVAGAALVAWGGLLVEVFDSGAAIQPGTVETVARWRGIGENPNTISLLCAIVLPTAAALALRAASRRIAALWWVAAASFALTIFGSQSRGALLGALVGIVLYAAVRPVRATLRLSYGAAAVVVLLAGVVASGPVMNRISPPISAAAASKAENSKSGGANGRESGGVTPEQRSFETLSASGRIDAWRGALHQAELRPVLGYGFGTEEHVFLSGRYRIFQGSRPENSYLGMLMQVGAIGLLLLLAVLGASLFAAVSALRRRVDLAALLVGVVASGLTLAVVQSYVYSVGNVAMVSFWLALLLAPTVRA
jgi:O-antigen ligase